jgi:hypothetical protein
MGRVLHERARLPESFVSISALEKRRDFNALCAQRRRSGTAAPFTAEKSMNDSGVGPTYT